MSTSVVSKVLWASVVRRHGMREQIEAAAAAGFDKLSVAADIYIQEQARGVTAKELLALAEDNGIVLDFLDGFCGWAPVQFADYHGDLVRQVMKLPMQQCFDICGELGLKTIVTMPWYRPGALDISLLVEHFVDFCGKAARLGINADLEFTPIWGIPDLKTAWRIVEAANCANSTIMMDTWNFARGNADLELLRAIPAHRIVNIQLTDGLYLPGNSDLLLDSLFNRKMPGEGQFPLLDISRILVAKGSLQSAGPEVFYVTDDAPEPRGAARHAAASTSRVMSEAGMSLDF